MRQLKDTSRVVIVISDTIFDDYKEIIKTLPPGDCYLLENEDEIGLVIDNKLIRFGLDDLPEDIKTELIGFLLKQVDCAFGEVTSNEGKSVESPPKKLISNMRQALFPEKIRGAIQFVKI